MLKQGEHARPGEIRPEHCFEGTGVAGSLGCQESDKTTIMSGFRTQGLGLRV